MSKTGALGVGCGDTVIQWAKYMNEKTIKLSDLRELSGKIIIATENTTFSTNTGHIRVLGIASRNSSVTRWVTRHRMLIVTRCIRVIYGVMNSWVGY